MKSVTKAMLLLICLSSCKGVHKDSLAPAAYIEYVENKKNGLKGVIESGVYRYSIQYKPSSYIAMKEMPLGTSDSVALKKRVQALSNTLWFNVTISTRDQTTDPLKYGVADLKEYNQRLDYFLNVASRNFRLSYGNAEARQIGYYFENNYSIKPEVTAIVGFYVPDEKPLKTFKLEYDDELLKSGILKFGVSVNDLNNIPKLAL